MKLFLNFVSFAGPFDSVPGRVLGPLLRDDKSCAVVVLVGHLGVAVVDRVGVGVLLVAADAVQYNFGASSGKRMSA